MNKYKVEISFLMDDNYTYNFTSREVNAINHRGAYDIAKAKWPEAVILSTERIA